MAVRRLSTNTKKVLCGLCRYPDWTDRALGKTLAINTSTISTIRQRLRDDDMMRLHRLPNLVNLRGSNLVVSSGRFRHRVMAEVRENIAHLGVRPALPIMSISDDISWLTIGTMPVGPTDVERDLDPINDRFFRDMTYDVHRLAVRPDNVRVFRYFDFSHLLCKTLDIPNECHLVEPEEPWSVEELSPNDRKVLEGLINEPESSDYRRSQILDMSHPTYTKIRRSLHDRGIAKPIIMPDLRTMEYSHLVWYTITLPEGRVDDNALCSICAHPNNVFAVQDPSTIFAVAIHNSEKDRIETRGSFTQTLSDHHIPLDAMRTGVFPLVSEDFGLTFRPIEVTRGVLGIRDEEVLAEEDPLDDINEVLQSLGVDDEMAKNIIETAQGMVDTTDGMVESDTRAEQLILELLTEPGHLESLGEETTLEVQSRLVRVLNDIRARKRLLQSTSDGTLTGAPDGRTLLIVEDSITTTEVLSEMLVDAGYTIVGTRDTGQDAVETYRTLMDEGKTPDAVIMDVFIKGMNGVETTRKLKEMDPDICIIVLTSSLNSKIKVMMTSMGVKEYFVKPVTRYDLVQGISRALNP